MLLRHDLHAFSRQSACFFRQPFHPFVDENKRDTPVSPSFFSKMSEIRPFLIHFFLKTNEMHPFLNHFSSKRAKRARFSLIFFKNKRDTPVSHAFSAKQADLFLLLSASLLGTTNPRNCRFAGRRWRQKKKRGWTRSAKSVGYLFK